MVKALIGRCIACGLLLLSFTGCAPATAISTDVVPINTFTPALTVIPSSTPTTLSTANQPLKFYFPEIEKRCPENREVPFEQLGLGSETVAVLLDLDRTGLWRYSAENQEPIFIKEIPFTAWNILVLNPTGEILALITRNEDNSSSIWLVSLISDSQREMFRIDYFEGAFPNIRWVSNDELLVTGSCPGAGCPFPIKVLNATNEIEMDVEDTYSSPYDNYQSFVVNAREYLAIYSSYADDGYSQFYAYDYIADRKLPIFPWLEERIFFYPLVGTNLGLLDSGRYFAMIVEQSYGFDVGVINANIKDLTQDLLYDSVMKRVIAEIQFSDLKYSLIDLNPSNKSLMMSMSYTDYLVETVDIKNVESALFAVDLDSPVLDDRMDRLVFVDYCFGTTEYFNQGFSPDGQIEVFRSDDEIVFLNLETGNISRLSGWLFIGWEMK